MPYTREELAEIHRMRKAEREQDDRDNTQWQAAPVGTGRRTDTYVIEYRHEGDSTWYGATPFYEPLSTHPEWTDSYSHAQDVAAGIREGVWGVTKQSAPGERKIVATRVIQHWFEATIMSINKS